MKTTCTAIVLALVLGLALMPNQASAGERTLLGDLESIEHGGYGGPSGNRKASAPV
ncbi:MAG: hypothetical protein HN712_10895 [Gemmatimonadetes bacterium]|jgi:hypothetical protein|nr:hypothetical protein [Gemmatimonadota bacterium]MBT6145500.1 hypothetical protein [Gemmatimonadota bacterium]MBT7860812.1 hypothetical protein [Gemmatimonadota bacterium]